MFLPTIVNVSTNNETFKSANATLTIKMYVGFDLSFLFVITDNIMIKLPEIIILQLFY